jgi:hypothetical protein
MPISEVYPKQPSLVRKVNDKIAAGAALADLNGDGYDDLIVANGSDMYQQHLFIYYNQTPQGNPEIFSKEPDWTSTECGYMNGVAVGDVDGDGWLDVAVAGAFGTKCVGKGDGGVHVFFNHHGVLEKTSTYQTADHYLPVDVALADVNADGRLDLLVAVYSETPKWPVKSPNGWKAKRALGLQNKKCSSFLPVDPDSAPAQSRIYENRGGKLSTLPSWRTRERLNAASVVAADINQDGWMDVAFAGQRTAVYYGHGRQSPGIPLPDVASWLSADTFVFSFSVAAGFPGAIPAAGGEAVEIGGGQPPAAPGLSLVVSGWNDAGAACNSRFYSYLPGVSAAPAWVSNPTELASRALLADLNADGLTDLVVDQLSFKFFGPDKGRPLWFFQGSEAGWAAAPTYQTDARAIGETLRVADLRHQNMMLHKLTFRAMHPSAVLTLPAWISGPPKVTRKGVSVASIWAPGGNWVSLAEPLAAGDSVEVAFESSPSLDLVEATFEDGIAVYLSQYKPSTRSSR